MWVKSQKLIHTSTKVIDSLKFKKTALNNL